MRREGAISNTTFADELGALNRSFIELVTSHGMEEMWSTDVSMSTVHGLRGLSEQHRKRLASCGYALFHFDLSSTESAAHSEAATRQKWALAPMVQASLESGSKAQITTEGAQQKRRQFVLAVLIFLAQAASSHGVQLLIMLSIEPRLLEQIKRVSVIELVKLSERMQSKLVMNKLGGDGYWQMLLEQLCAENQKKYQALKSQGFYRSVSNTSCLQDLIAMPARSSHLRR